MWISAGNFIREDKNDTEKAKRKYGISPTLMGWYEIQQAFYRLLPADTVTFDSRCAYGTSEDIDPLLTTISWPGIMRMTLCLSSAHANYRI